MSSKQIVIILCICIFISIGSNFYLYAAVAVLDVTTKKISDNLPMNGNITWSGVTNDGNTNWKRADQYLEIASQMIF